MDKCDGVIKGSKVDGLESFWTHPLNVAHSWIRQVLLGMER
jgi:hypothetical protein